MEERRKSYGWERVQGDGAQEEKGEVRTWYGHD